MKRKGSKRQRKYPEHHIGKMDENGGRVTKGTGIEEKLIRGLVLGCSEICVHFT